MKRYCAIFTVFVLLIAVFIMQGCAPGKPPVQPAAPTPVEQKGAAIPEPGQMITDSAQWKEEFPKIYESFMRTAQMGDDQKESSSLGGQHPRDYLQRYPNIKVLYEGMGFAKEYYQARGHYYALEDVINSARPKPGASCLACKTGEYEKLAAENGEALYVMDFQQTAQKVKSGISCYNCHRNNPGEGVQITASQLMAGLPKLKKQLKPGTQACAQCHVEYYLEPASKAAILPWDKGIEVSDIEAYYDEMGFSDWKHPRTGTPLIKVQHPETEMYSGSLHDSMGVSCASCHMPEVTEDGQKYTSHWAKSPLKTPEESCGQCHGEEAKNLAIGVQAIQKSIDKREAEVSDMLVKLIEDFAAAIEQRKLDDATIEKVRELHRKAQYRWDFVFVENSTGFHNEVKANKALDEARDYAQQGLKILKEVQ